jgi:hypothetical protein
MARELRGCRAHSSCAADDVAAWSAAECWASELAPYSNRLNVSPDGTFTLTRLGKRRCSERNLGEWWWRSLIYEPLKPSQRRSLGARPVQVNNQCTEGERVLERQSVHLTRCYLRRVQVPTLDGALEAAVSCALAGRHVMQLGRRLRGLYGRLPRSRVKRL